MSILSIHNNNDWYYVTSLAIFFNCGRSDAKKKCDANIFPFLNDMPEMMVVIYNFVLCFLTVLYL